MVRTSIAAAIVSLAIFHSAPLKAQECGDILIQQIDFERSSQSQFRSWLQMIDEHSYSAAQQKAGGSAYGGLFSGDYGSFNQKRTSYFKNEQSIEDLRSAKEAFKSSLTSDQVAGWVKCATGRMEFAITYENVDDQGATIVMNWGGSELAGPMRELSSKFDGVETEPDVARIGPFSGKTSFIVKRASKDLAIRGTVSGKAGVGPTMFSANIYVPPIKPVENRKLPSRSMLTLNGRVLTSTAYWSRKRYSKSWDCINVPEDSETIILQTRDDWLGRRRGQCVGNDASYCDSHNEGCSDKVVVRGCTVSREWHEQYKAFLARVGLPYSREAVCDPDAKVTA